MKPITFIFSIFAALAALPAAAGTVTLTVYERGDDVVFSAAGILDLSDFTMVSGASFGTGVDVAEGRFALGGGGTADVWRSTASIPLPAIGTAGIIGPGTGSAGIFALTDLGVDDLVDVAVAAGFTSGGSVSETLVFENQTFGSLGIFASVSADVMLTASQTYSLRVGNQFAPAVVPLPAGGLLLLTGAGALVAARRRKTT
ncbi:VPLPA-CTERM sorting domain-containing protein [uncultured Roseobacter sp.]|uniref:VPLPA-CTERM sorting domain-containing protein n=1 Tax=uncultured Roseobacter sp. TaxID=114847 RepID=UPI00260F2938|nr:VPLPA-CTERM sorting domain-containing protein [uncultured Roseobacter sp.]